MSEVTRMLTSLEYGDASAAEKLLPLVYNELRRLAAAKMANEAADHSLQPTALVHEAYVRLVDVQNPQQWEGRGHFFAAAAEAMRRILVDMARRKKSAKRGAGYRRVQLEQLTVGGVASGLDLVALDEALKQFEATDPKKAAVVKLRFFGGLSMMEVAAAQGISVATANRYWAYARVWLLDKISSPGESRES